jgi:hypothetical protein
VNLQDRHGSGTTQEGREERKRVEREERKRVERGEEEGEIGEEMRKRMLALRWQPPHSLPFNQWIQLLLEA